MRNFNRKKNQIREITVEKNYISNAHGSCLISFGNTKVICTATLEKDIPSWLKNSGSGWLTAEYSMLPASTTKRNIRNTKFGKQSSRSIEIQRLIGRSLRNIIDLKKISGYQFLIDCDVIEADGGTRTVSINGAYIALGLAVKKFIDGGVLVENPIKDFLGAISCGILDGEIFVDLDYKEDSRADVDANFVFTKNSGIAEIQISAEKNTFNQDSTVKMISYCQKAVEKIFKLQKKIIS